MNKPRLNTVLLLNVIAYRAHDRSLEVWKMETHEIECCTRGYHVYQDVWEAAVDEELVCRPERSNAHDWYTVAVMKNDLVVDHLPSRLVIMKHR